MMVLLLMVCSWKEQDGTGHIKYAMFTVAIFLLHNWNFHYLQILKMADLQVSILHPL